MKDRIEASLALIAEAERVLAQSKAILEFLTLPDAPPPPASPIPQAARPPMPVAALRDEPPSRPA